MTTKNKVLSFLEKNRGVYLSGAKMAESLNISRNAVWKAIKQLEKEGFEIEAVSSKGYSLSTKSNQMSEVGIQEHLPEQLKEQDIYYFEQINSTNKKAKELASHGANHGTLIVANEQTAGSGRYGRVFESPKDSGIYMSMILKPDEMFLKDPTLITAYAAVIVSNVIESMTGKKVGIKWVNDLFLDGKKVCGILTEAVTNFESGQIEWIVVGIGINLTTSSHDFSEEVRKKAGALLEEEVSISRNDLVARIFKDFMSPNEQMSVENVMKEYKEKSIILNKRVLIQQGKEELLCLIKDIDNQGQLVIQKDSGEISTFNSGEIRVVVN